MRHGKASTYRNHRCRCESCRAAWNEYMKRYQARKRQEQHEAQLEIDYLRMRLAGYGEEA